MGIFEHMYAMMEGKQQFNLCMFYNPEHQFEKVLYIWQPPQLPYDGCELAGWQELGKNITKFLKGSVLQYFPGFLIYL